MRKPICDYVNQYVQSKTSRLHMPGHKGVSYLGPEPYDITEIKGADELYCPEGIIEESEKNASELFGTYITAYSTEGSSHCIRSMLLLAGQLRDNDNKKRILAARNAHKAFLYACAICDYEVKWIYPSKDAKNSVAACQPEASVIEEMLTEAEKADKMPFAVYITSPDYLGHCADIKKISEVCHKFGCLLLVDNAHGAYMRFLEKSLHPMDNGADMCSDSAHKTLPVLTGGAYLHVNTKEADVFAVKSAMELSGTTSPSYIIMQSLDMCNATLYEGYAQKIRNTCKRLDEFKNSLRELDIPFADCEPMKLVISAAEMGFTGTELGELLRCNDAEPEFCDHDYLVCMMTPDTDEEAYRRLKNTLVEAKSYGRLPIESTPLKLVPLKQEKSIRKAVFSRHETIRTEAAAGRICGAPTVSCPPAIPIAISGERITEDACHIMKAYNIEWVSVCSE